MGKKITKIDRVLRYLETHRGITSMQAFQNYGVTRLAAIIYDLRHHRHLNIETVNTTGHDKYGTPISYATYVLHKDEEK